MKDDDSELGCGILVVVAMTITAMLAALAGDTSAEREIHAEAVKLGYGSYVLDNGGPTFKWNPTPVPAEKSD